MPSPFEFSPYHDANADNTIAQLLSDRGRIQAEGARASGNAWAGAVQNIAQNVAQIPQQIQQQKQQAIQQQTQQNTLTDQNRSVAARDAFSKLLKDTPQLSEDGVSVWDIGTISKGMAAAGFGPEGASAAQHLDAVNNAFRQARAAQLAVVKTGAQAVIASGNDPSLASHFIDQLATNKLYPADQIEKFRAFIQEDPANVAKLTAYLAGPQKMERGAPGSMAVNPLTGQVVPDSQVPDPKGDAQIAATKARDEELARHNVAMETINKLTAGRAAAAQAETARHNKAMEAAANPLAALQTGAATTTAQATGPTGDDFLKTLPANIQSEVKAYAEGRRPFPSGMALKSPYFQSLIQLVGQYDPTFDAANYNARNKARTDLTSPNGQGAKTINALNTVLQHAGKLSDLIEKLDNYESPIANSVVNPLRNRIAGKTEVTNFNAVAPQVMKEIERAWRGTGGSAGEIKDLIASLGVNLGKQQQREALNQLMELVKGKLDATQQQRDNIMGPAAASIPILFDQNKGVIDKITQRAGGEKGAIAEGTDGTVNGVPAVWRKGDKGLGWYAR